MNYLAEISPRAITITSAAIGILFILFSITRFVLQTRRPPGFPPGPPTKLGLGNVHQVPLKKPYLKFQEWHKTYGDIIGLKMGPKNFVVLSSPALLHEAFVKRGVKYGGRPTASVAIQNILSQGTHRLHIIFMPYDRALNKWRGAVRHLLTQDAVVRQADIMSSVGDKLVYNLLHKSAGWVSCIQRWALEMPLLAIAGRRLEDYGPGFAEWYLDNQHDWLDFLEPSSTPPVELFPWLIYLPSFLATWKVRAAKIRKGVREIYFKTLDATKKKVADGADRSDSLYTHLLRQREQPGKQETFTDDQLAFMGGGLLDAALDTTLSGFETLLMCLVTHEDPMRRAREEVDQVCGENMPRCEDMKNLPFLTACLMETLRWRGPANIALPHLLTEDDVLGGYAIPKGTTILANIHSVHLREEDYDRPTEFIPDRFLANGSGSTEDPGRKLLYSFSLGRRSCPGEDFAKTFIVTTAAKMLWAFDITTQDGRRPDLSWETGFASGLVTSPKGFKPKLTPRTEERSRVVAERFQASEEYLSKWFG
ncbi:hypothetical protein FDECE_11771 [Fusarium decemcellulare]|nr:hypothetical protein FDECE_11771 [Fusarium decemcellulare]